MMMRILALAVPIPPLATRAPILAAAFALTLPVSSLTPRAWAKTACVTRQELTARGMGIVHKYHVSDGDTVKKGDPIVEFDARLHKAGLKEAQGALDAAKANEELAADALGRLEKLKNSEAVTEQQIAEARIRLMQAKAVKRQAEGAVERVRVQLEDTVIRAALPGQVRGLPTIVGMFVQVGHSLGRVESSQAHCAGQAGTAP